MKTKVIIENHQTKIILEPETEFEKDVIEKVYDSKPNYDIEIEAFRQTNHGVYNKHKFTIELIAKTLSK